MNRHEEYALMVVDKDDTEILDLLDIIGKWSDKVETEKAKQMYHALMNTIYNVTFNK